MLPGAAEEVGIPTRASMLPRPPKSCQWVEARRGNVTARLRTTDTNTSSVRVDLTDLVPLFPDEKGPFYLPAVFVVRTAVLTTRGLVQIHGVAIKHY
jgi:hypothetical protein